jgi:hypothetical protein
MENKTFDEISWIQSYFEGQVNFGYEAVESVRNFTLIWNMFEAIACNKMVTIKAIEDFVSELHYRKPLRVDDFTFFLKFVSDRYIDDKNEIKPRFYNLNFRRGDRNAQELVENVLKKNLTDVESVAKALLFITFRLRNNLLHGEKNIVTLDTQEEYFKLANQLIAKFLDLHKRANHIVVEVKQN